MVVPDSIRGNRLSQILDAFLKQYSSLARNGRIFGLAIIDQDAKTLAVNTFFDEKVNYWDLGAIGAALFGVARQGQDFFQVNSLERASLIYDSKQLFVHSIGQVSLPNQKVRELILLVLCQNLNIGLIIMQMRRFAPQIKKYVQADINTQKTMQLSESEFHKQIATLKKELFNIAGH
ncbi:MAG: hypothetical protein ACTSVL_12235 [Promethearchaeota archaeon]